MNFTFFCEAQMIWDAAMAVHALDYLARPPRRHGGDPDRGRPRAEGRGAAPDPPARPRCRSRCCCRRSPAASTRRPSTCRMRTISHC
ncbi:MAG: hypothetical protein MZV70_55515 [Desulfobacterales bacterium]|nr:hypothetical protein [Desulfobacterales bacterium]